MNGIPVESEVQNIMIRQAVEQYQQDSEEMMAHHVPVMFNEILEYLKPSSEAVFVDGTLGLGGHAEAILRLIGPAGRLIGIDRDERSLRQAQERLAPFSQQCAFIHDDFRNVDTVLRRLEIPSVDGILLDLGVSSFQLDDPQRGFSLRFDGPLDMRLDQDSPISAYDLVNSLSEKELSAIIKDYGQERWHSRIARYLVSERVKHPIETTQELREIILRAIPYRNYKEKIHPATRTFQAFRIAVNRELEALEVALDRCVASLKPNGRIAVIAFHSLEDKIVKEKFRSMARAGQVRLLVKKPLRPSEQESTQNPRARSARLRIAERI